MNNIRGRFGQTLVAIVTIVKEEFDAVKEIGGFEEHAGKSNCLYRSHFGDNNYDAILVKTADRSNGPCQETISRLVELFRPEYIILSGIGGGVEGRDGVSLGDVTVADHIQYYEMRKLVDGSNNARWIPFDHPSVYLRDTVAARVINNETWIERIKVKRPVVGQPKIIVGNLIAGEKILGDKQNVYQSDILNEFDKAIVVDMESYGLARGVYSARGARYYNLNYLVVRGISDLVNQEHNDKTRTEWRDYAASAAAAFTMETVDQIVDLCE